MSKLLNIFAKLDPVPGLTGASLNWCDWAHSLHAGAPSSGECWLHTRTRSTELNKASWADLNFCCWLKIEPHKSCSEQHLQEGHRILELGLEWGLMLLSILSCEVKNPTSFQKMKHFTGQARKAFPELLESLAHRLMLACTAQLVLQPQIFFLKAFPFLTSVAPSTKHLPSIKKET